MKKYSVSPVVFAVFLLSVLLSATGCQDDESPVGIDPPPITEPRTASELVSRFLTAYEARDADKYLALLDPDFLFLLQSDTTGQMPSVGAFLDFTEEERIHQRMFSGEAVTDPQGDFRPGVLDIEFLHFEALDHWSVTDNETLFPDSVWAPFEVELVFDCGTSHGTFEVSGVTRVYARAYSRLEDGREITYYRLAGMVDLTQSGKGVVATPWGLIKAFFS